MPNSMAETSECGGDDEVRAEEDYNGEGGGGGGGGTRSRDEGGDDCESHSSNSDSTAGLNGGEEGRLPARVEVVGGNRLRYPNHRGSSSSEGVFAKNGDFAKLGPNTKDTELRLGLPETKDDGLGTRASSVRLPDPAFFDGILQGSRIKQNLSRNEPSPLVPRCSLDSQPRASSIQAQGQEYVSKEEFKLKPMFREFTAPDLPFDVRFSLPRLPLENRCGARVSSSGAKRIFSETLEARRETVSQGEPKLYMPPPLPSSSFNFPFAGGPTAWGSMKWEQNKTAYGQFPGHMGSNETKMKEAALPTNPPRSDQKGDPAEPQPSRNQTGTSSEQRAAPVVGWPPVRSFRRNLSSQPKPAPPAQAPPPPPPPPPPPVVEKKAGTMFVKVNVEGVPIGRKIDLKAYDSYDKLSLALDDMFRNSFPVQNPSSSSANPPFSLSGGEYVLVYEDDEGDRMLVGDVPWGMFVTTVKRLRVIRSSEARRLANRDSSLNSKVGTC